MTDYSKMNHQQLYDYVHSGNPDSMNTTAQAWQSHSQALEDATSQLQTNLTAIQSQWQGAAADAYFQQSQTVATKMQTHADDAANTSTAVTNTAGALSWARNNMPAPPSWLEQKAADIDSNFVSGAIGFLSTGGEATVASELAKHDIANKHQQAISTMTQLASAYSSAQAQLPSAPPPSVPPGGHYDDPENGSGNGNGNGTGTGTAPVMPVPVYPIGGTGGGGGYSGGTGSGGGGGYGGYGSGTGGAGGGSASSKVPTYSDPGGTTYTQGGAGAGTTGDGYGGSSSPYSSPAGGAASGNGSGSGEFGGGIGAGALGAGAGGLGSGAFGSGAYGTGKGGTSLGAGEGSGIGTGKSTTGKYGSGAAAAAEGEGAAGTGAAAQGQQGMMGGAGGRGGAGGKEEERGNRAGFLRQDPDYWYGDKQAAPPGGVIE